MKIELNLLDNGLDFIIEGLKPTTRLWGYDNTESIWKYSVLNVFSGIELILKERLRREHWSLIFEDVSNAKEQKLIQGDFISVNHNNVVKRLKGICNITINDTPINTLRKLRNKFEHFEVKVKIEECKEAIAKAIREIIVFWNNHISPYSNEEQNQKFNWIVSMATEFDAYVGNIFKKHQKKIDNIIQNNAGVLIHCQNCKNHSFMIYKDESKKFECFVCEEKITKKDFLKNKRESELKESKEEDTLIKYEEYDYKCTNCENQARIRFKPSHFLVSNEYQPDYFFCIDCLYIETQTDIDQRELEKELKELEERHTPEEYIKILRERAKSLLEKN